MIRLLLATCILTICSAGGPCALAQTSSEVRATQFYVLLGVAETNPQPFNQSLGSALGIAERTPAWGFGGSVVLGRLVLGGEAEVQYARRTATPGRETRLGMGNGLMMAGYIVAESSRYLLYPTVGIGGGGAEFRRAHRADDSESGLALPSGARVQSGFAFADLRLHGDAFVRPGAGLVVGFSVGYRLGLLHSDWRYRDDDQGDPAVLRMLGDYDPSGLSIRLRIGWGIHSTTALKR